MAGVAVVVEELEAVHMRTAKNFMLGCAIHSTERLQRGTLFGLYAASGVVNGFVCC